MTRRPQHVRGCRWSPGIFPEGRADPLALAEKIGAELGARSDSEILIHDVKPLVDAGAGELSFFDNRKYLPQLQSTRALACLLAPAFAERVPKGTAVVLTPTPYRAFALALQHIYPDAMIPKAALAS